MNWLRGSLAIKFIFLVVCVLAVTLGSLAFVNHRLQSQRLYDQLLQQTNVLGGFVATISPEAIYGYDYALLDNHMRDLSGQQDVIYSVITSPDGTPMTSYLDHNNAHIIKALKLYDRHELNKIMSEIDACPCVSTTEFPITHAGDTLGMVKLGISRERIDALASESLYEDLFVSALALIILGSGIYGVFQYSTLRSIRHLTHGAERVKKGELDKSVSVFSCDELGRLTNTFNQMTAYLKENIEQKDVALQQIKGLNEALQKEVEERKTAEQAALSASHTKSTFLANMSHEIRTPMNAILGYAQIMQRDQSLSKEHCESLATIERSGDHLLGLINDILDLSKIEVGAMKLQQEDFDLAGMMQSVMDMFRHHAEQKNLKLILLTNVSTFTPVRGDQGKLRQVIVNLLGNAIKFTDAGSVTLKITANEGRYLFEIKDTGPGIAPEERGDLFDPFIQSNEGIKKGGTGLGLTISRQIVDLMGGELLLESVVGKGSRFYFSIDLKPAESDIFDLPVYSTVKKWTRLQPGCKVTALVADDVKQNRDVLCKLLISIGVNVIEAEDGLIAAEQILLQKPDIAFMDIRMPNLDGKQAVKKIRKQLGSDAVKCVAITAFLLDSDKNEFLQIGFDDYIPKPFRFERICECLSTLLKVKFVDKSDSASNIDALPGLSKHELNAIQLPQEVLENLKEAVARQEITYIETVLDEIKQYGARESDLSRVLKKLTNQYQFSEMHELIENVSYVS